MRAKAGVIANRISYPSGHERVAYVAGQDAI